MTQVPLDKPENSAEFSLQFEGFVHARQALYQTEIFWILKIMTLSFISLTD
jgi:hypothetical protein